MPFFTTALALGGLSAAGAIGGSAIASHAAGKAADTQSQAAMSAAQLQKQSADEALSFQKQQYSDQQANLKPWLQAGQGALSQLSGLMQPGGDLTKQFQAPTGVTEQNDPGFQFRLQQGQQALERSAASRGGLLSGGTAKSLDAYSQGQASQEYGNVYNRAFNEFQTNQANQYNRLAGIAGTGQTAANTLGQSGQAASNNISNLLLTSGQQQGNAVQNAAAARSSGYINGANALNSGISGATNGITQAVLLRNLFGAGVPGNSAPKVNYGAYTGLE